MGFFSWLFGRRDGRKKRRRHPQARRRKFGLGPTGAALAEGGLTQYGNDYYAQVRGPGRLQRSDAGYESVMYSSGVYYNN